MSSVTNCCTLKFAPEIPIKGFKAMNNVEITIIQKEGGILGKRFELRQDGTLKADGSACVMSVGNARRHPLQSMTDLAATIMSLNSSEALTIGRLIPGLPDEVEVVTKRRALNGNAGRAISRTQEFFVLPPGKDAVALIDH